MTNSLEKYRFVLPMIVCIAIISLNTGCGNKSTLEETGGSLSATDPPSFDMASAAKSSVALANYNGRLTLTFKENTNVRLRFGKFVSLSGYDLSSVNAILGKYPQIKIKRALTSMSEKTAERIFNKAKARGINSTNWNLKYTLTVADQNLAEEIIDKLAGHADVERIWPGTMVSLASLPYSELPDYSDEQNYLKPLSEDPSGVDAEYAWNMGVRGAGVTVVDVEFTWDFSHEDLNISEDDILMTYVGVTQEDIDEFNADEGIVNHGTAVSGIINGKDDNHGITGLAPDANLNFLRTEGEVGALIVAWAKESVLDCLPNENNEIDSNWCPLKPGDIVLIELAENPPTPSDVGNWTPSNPPGTSDNPQAGTLPVEYSYEVFDLIKQATAAGLVIIEAAGNGSMNLCNTMDPNNPFQLDKGYSLCAPEYDSGAIMVGAANKEGDFIFYTNYGSRVNVHALGEGVLSTGFKSSEPNYYTHTFAGTSSASAIVAGAAAVIQNYFKEKYWEGAFLNSYQMREIVVQSGINTGTCVDSIGCQPNIQAAFDIIDSGAYDDAGWIEAPPPPLADIFERRDLTATLDLDGDDLAELIVFNVRNDGVKEWYIDYSSDGVIGEDYDQIVTIPEMKIMVEEADPENENETILVEKLYEDSIIVPVCNDYNSDGYTDLALFNMKHGVWFIDFSDPDAANHGFGAWDRIYVSNDFVPYSRPWPGDYDGNKWIDLAIVTPDGRWMIDFGGPGQYYYGNFDKKIDYLTDEQLEAVDGNGWAYLPAAAYFDGDNKLDIGFKGPDGTEYSGIIHYIKASDFLDFGDSIEEIQHSYQYDIDFGGNDSIPVMSNFAYTPYNSINIISTKNTNGNWKFALSSTEFEEDGSDGIFGNATCRPVATNYYGNLVSDRAVYCMGSQKWIIPEFEMSESWGDFTIELTKVNEYEMPLNDSKYSLPGKTYYGGISYQDSLAFYNAMMNYLKYKDSIFPTIYNIPSY